jgi:hypothetical protein
MEPWNAFTDWGWNNWKEILGVGSSLASLWAALEVKRLRKAWTARQRLPDLKQKLTKQLKALEGLLVSTDTHQRSSKEVASTITTVRAILVGCKKKLVSTEAKRANKALITECQGLERFADFRSTGALEGKLKAFVLTLDNEIQDLNAIK